MSNTPGFTHRLGYLASRLESSWDKPEEGPESTLRALWAVAFGTPMSVERAASWVPQERDTEGLVLLDGLIARRVAGVPLGHLTGRQQFMGTEFFVNDAALLPRQQTEILARCALEALHAMVAARGHALVVDTCCGSGNVALALARLEPGARVIGIDLSPESVQLAQSNARALGLEDRVEFAVGDLFAPLEVEPGTIDLITCNPPYISTSKLAELQPELGHEPDMAFDGGPFGVSILTRLIRDAARFLRPGGILAFEVGRGQGAPMQKRVERAATWSNCESFPDSLGHIRALRALRTAEAA